MDAELHDFLRYPDWERGTPLADKYADAINAARLGFIQKHQNSFTLDMLVQELTAIGDLQPRPAAPEPVKADPLPRTEKTTRFDYSLPDAEDLPQDLAELREQIVAWLRLQQEDRGVLKAIAYGEEDADTGKALNKVAGSILRTEEQLQEAYARLDYYKRHGKYMPGSEPKDAMDRIKDLIRRQITNYTYINKYKKSAKPEVQAEIEKRRLELKELKAWLDE